MRKKIAAANWKMNTSLEEGIKLTHELIRLTPRGFSPEVNIILAPPATHLASIAPLIETHQAFFLSGQNMHQQESGAYTGEISAIMLKSVGCSYVILGHSERRQYFGETDTILAKKVNSAIRQDLSPLFCLGETLEVREKGETLTVINSQLQKGLFHLSQEQVKHVILAYEPIWAIGTGKTASPEQAQEVHAFIRTSMAKHYGEETARQISILYGGSVKPQNAKALFSQPDIDGGLVGGASLDAEAFIRIVNAL